MFSCLMLERCRNRKSSSAAGFRSPGRGTHLRSDLSVFPQHKRSIPQKELTWILSLAQTILSNPIQPRPRASQRARKFLQRTRRVSFEVGSIPRRRSIRNDRSLHTKKQSVSLPSRTPPKIKPHPNLPPLNSSPIDTLEPPVILDIRSPTREVT